MANWCSNTVEFLGEHSQMEQLKNLFDAMAAKEKRERKGQLPAFAAKEGGFLFETSWEQGILHYLTKWSPNIALIKKVADHFGVGFIYTYDEPGNLVLGEAAYKGGVLTDIFLDDDDYDQYQYDDEKRAYVFEEQGYENNYEILEILLERKKALRALQQ